MPKKVGMVSLGCSKNQVDGEMMLSLIKEGGFELCSDPALCDVVIVNTCGFIEDAKRESIESIMEFCDQKKQGNLKAVIVTGCLAERYREELEAEIPEVDVILGIGSNSSIVEAVQAAFEGQHMMRFGEKTDLPLSGSRVLANAPYFAYLKLGDGCDNWCTYCAIPMIRGPFRSRPMEDIVSEARELVEGGVKEINLIAQDTSRYGEELYGKLMLPQLLTELCKIEGLVWLRLLYCYPDRITDELLDVIANEDKIVKYLDVPIQHASKRILMEMNRYGDKDTLLALVAKLRRRVPGITIRTTLIAGFPGESDEDFTELCEMVQEARFDRLGCFAYSIEEDTPAGEMEDQLDERTKARRAEVVMTEQYAIATALCKEKRGTTVQVLTEGFDKDVNMYFGRSGSDAPDIDTKVYFKGSKNIKGGDMVWVKIKKCREYDLVGFQVAGKGTR